MWCLFTLCHKNDKKKSKISTHLDNTIFKKENKKNGRSQIIHCYCRKQNVLYIFIKQLIDIKLC